MKAHIVVIALTVLASTLFAEVNIAKCYGCHGTSFEKVALNKSLIVQDMNSTAIYDSLKGYKDGTYGGPMKGIMKAQVQMYTDKQIQEITTKITKTKGN